MKSVLISCIFIVVGLVSCDTEEDPTTFRGEVVFPEDYALEEDDIIRVIIKGNNSNGIGTPGDDIGKVGNADIDLDSEKRFEKTFPAMKVDDFSLGIYVIDSDSTLEVALNGNDLDCSPHDCGSLQPGKTYDLTVRVVE